MEKFKITLRYEQTYFIEDIKLNAIDYAIKQMKIERIDYEDVEVINVEKIDKK